MYRHKAAVVLLALACAVAAVAEQQAPSAHPTAQVEALLSDVWKLLSTETLFPRPMPGGTVSKLLEQQRGAGSGGSDTATAAFQPTAAAVQKPAPPERPSAQWAAVAQTEADAWEVLRYGQAAEAGPAAAVAATLPARLAALDDMSNRHSGAAAGAPGLPTTHPKLSLSWWFERKDAGVDVISRPLGNATFLSLGISKTRLLRHMQDGSSQEYWEWQLSFSVSTLGMACLALGALCLALFRYLTREDEHSCDCGCDCDCEHGCERGFDCDWDNCCSCGSCSCDGCEERKGGSSPEYIKSAGYIKL